MYTQCAQIRVTACSRTQLTLDAESIYDSSLIMLTKTKIKSSNVNENNTNSEDCDIWYII